MRKVRRSELSADTPVFGALADPVRRSLLLKLAESGPRTATQLATGYPMTRQGVLKHLGILEAAGLVDACKQGRERRYTFKPGPLAELERWRRAITARWERRLLRLKSILEQEKDGVHSTIR